MTIPPIHKDTAKLFPAYRTALTTWLNKVTLAFPGLTVTPCETWRTVERQQYLYAQNRPGHWVTNMDGLAHTSLHQHGLAADIMVIDKASGKAIWDTSKYLEIYKAVPPGSFGLETLIPSEYGHLQIAGGYLYLKKHLIPVIGGL